MTLPASFSNNTAPTGGQLDANFLAVAALGILDGTVTGTNAILFTQNNNQPPVSVYANDQKFAFSAAANSTAAVTLQVGALAALPVYLPTGVQAGNGSIANGSYYVVVYLSALNSGSGGFLIISAVPGSVTAPVLVANAQGLVVKNNSSVPNTRIDISAKQAVLQTTGGAPLLLTSGTAPAVTIDLTTTGANGMDVGARPTSGWVYCYLISTGSVTAGLATATSPTSGLPTMPGGYSYYLYVGAAWCNGSQNLFGFRQNGRQAQFLAGVAGTGSTFPNTNTTLAAFSAVNTSSWIPATAGVFHFICVNSTSSAVNAVNSNNTPTTVNSEYITQNTIADKGSIVLENAATVYVATTAGTFVIYGVGWDDFYVNA